MDANVPVYGPHLICPLQVGCFLTDKLLVQGIRHSDGYLPILVPEQRIIAQLATIQQSKEKHGQPQTKQPRPSKERKS